MGLAEFIHYVREHEKNLRLQFSHLDKNMDGKVDLEELISAFKDLGIEINKNEAVSLLNRWVAHDLLHSSHYTPINTNLLLQNGPGWHFND